MSYRTPNSTTTRDVCGTNAGAVAHRSRNEVACPACCDASTAYQREHRARAALGLPSARKIAIERPGWARRSVELADLAAVGPVLDAAWRWSA